MQNFVYKTVLVPHTKLKEQALNLKQPEATHPHPPQSFHEQPPI